MQHKPKNRTCPSCNCMSCRNILRQPEGEKNGKRPSITSTRASAIQSESPATLYFLALEDGAAAPEPPRKVLKKSELDGSITITSLFLLKLVL